MRSVIDSRLCVFLQGDRQTVEVLVVASPPETGGVTAGAATAGVQAALG